MGSEMLKTLYMDGSIKIAESEDKYEVIEWQR